MSLARSVPLPLSGRYLYGDFVEAYRDGLKESPMSLVFALLREDYIVFASDQRHVRGDSEGNYRNDEAWKTQPILNNEAMLGFAGDDHGEEIIASLRRSGALDKGCLAMVATAIKEEANRRYEKSFNEKRWPLLAFLLAGFEAQEDKSIAYTYVVGTPCWSPLPRSYVPDTKCDNFEIIGRPCHGALYVLRKCAPEVRDIETEIRLAVFSLVEVSRYDTSVGGRPQVCIVRPGRPVEDLSDSLQAHMKWAKNGGERIRQIIVDPGGPELIQSRSKRGR